MTRKVEIIIGADESWTKPVLSPHGEVLFAGADELIRCKDCKYWDGYYCHNKKWGDGYGNYTPPIKKEDGFCDWAERKEK